VFALTWTPTLATDLPLGAPKAAPDEIDGFVKSLNGLSLNGNRPLIDLPADTPPEQVVAAFAKLEKKNDRDGQFLGYRIVETKRIDEQQAALLKGDIVVLITSTKGSKTILVMENSQNGWTVFPFYITTVP
jgi:hypothetical protein